jgi:hypothetical protein
MERGREVIGSTHRIIGFETGVLFGLAAGFPAWQSLASGVIASASANGPFSPDGDQSWLAWTGRHRGITHWPGWPLLAIGLVPAPFGAGYAVVALALGYLSHIVADAVYGKPGVPLLPVTPWWHVGLGLRCEGRVKRYRPTPEGHWYAGSEPVYVKVGQSERWLRRGLQYLAVPLGAWVVLGPVVGQ